MSNVQTDLNLTYFYFWSTFGQSFRPPFSEIVISLRVQILNLVEITIFHFNKTAYTIYALYHHHETLIHISCGSESFNRKGTLCGLYLYQLFVIHTIKWNEMILFGPLLYTLLRLKWAKRARGQWGEIIMTKMCH